MNIVFEFNGNLNYISSNDIMDKGNIKIRKL